MRSGRAIPPRLLEPPPEVNPGLAFYMNAFWDLCSDRRDGGRIPWTAIDAWCTAHRVPLDERHDVHFLVGRTDMAFMNWTKKKRDKTADKKPTEKQPIKKR